MNRRGVCYDVGRVMWGQDRRPEFSPEEARRELQIIAGDLHCNAVRICGHDPGRLLIAGTLALDCGLEVWLSPELWDHSPSDTLDYIAQAAETAEELHRHRPGQVVLSVGSEATLFMAGIVEGGSVFERLEHPGFWQRVRVGEHNGPLNAFLAEAAERVREIFHGPLTYASVPLETVDWSPFDVVSVDLYRGAELKDRLTGLLLALGQAFRRRRPLTWSKFPGGRRAGPRRFRQWRRVQSLPSLPEVRARRVRARPARSWRPVRLVRLQQLHETAWPHAHRWARRAAVAKPGQRQGQEGVPDCRALLPQGVPAATSG